MASIFDLGAWVVVLRRKTMLPIAPAIKGDPIIPNDTGDISYRALYVGVPGDVKMTLFDSENPVTFKDMPVGIHPLAFKRIYATGTTATNLIGLE